MAHIQIDFAKSAGAVKPMHAVNNGPSMKSARAFSWGSGTDNALEFQAAGIPYARTHDASFYPGYGGEHTVDVHAIFPNFDADPTDPASYDFVCTDDYLEKIEAVGCKTFYRLGSKIEHEVKKYGTIMPKDFHKWAVICEHIIRHFTEGWADGYHMDIEYWEIWNEPDLDPDDSANKRCWSGTRQDFFEFYHVVATHLKACFPHLKIGGPACAGKTEWMDAFLAQLKAPLDFFSWHIYAHTVEAVLERVQLVQGLLNKYGFGHVESILNEWNYVLAWNGYEYKYGHYVKATEKGASFILGTMCECQKAPVDMLMYYDARPSGWCGLFDLMGLQKKTTKAYYAFPMFNTLYRLGESVLAQADGDGCHALGAKNEAGNEAAVILTRFNDDDATGACEVTVDLSGFGTAVGTEVEVYLLDADHDLEKLETLTYFGNRILLKKELPNFTSYLFKLKAL